MFSLRNVVDAWETPAFNAMLKREIEQLDADLLPLQQGLSYSSHVSGGKFSAIILSVVDAEDSLRVKAGIVYSGIIAGCSCADDPTPVDVIAEYCELLFAIDKASGLSTVILVDEHADQ